MKELMLAHAILCSERTSPPNYKRREHPHAGPVAFCRCPILSPMSHLVPYFKAATNSACVEELRLAPPISCSERTNPPSSEHRQHCGVAWRHTQQGRASGQGGVAGYARYTN